MAVLKVRFIGGRCLTSRQNVRPDVNFTLCALRHPFMLDLYCLLSRNAGVMGIGDFFVSWDELGFVSRPSKKWYIVEWNRFRR